MVGAGEEEVAGEVFDLIAGGEEVERVAPEAFEAAADVDEVVMGGEFLEEGRLEPFAGRIDDDQVAVGEGGGICVDALIGKERLMGGWEAFKAFLEREVGVGVVFDELDLGGFVAERKTDGAGAGEEFDDFLIGLRPRFDFLNHFFEERKMGLRKSAGMESDLSAIESMDEKGLSVEELPRISEDPVIGGVMEIEPDRVPKIGMFQERAAKRGNFWSRGIGVEDEYELDPVCFPIDGELQVAEVAGWGIFCINGETVSGDFVFDECGGAVDRGMMDAAIGDRDDFVGPFFKKAYFRGRPDGEFGLQSGLVESVRVKDGTEMGRGGLEKGEGVVPNGWMEKIFIQFASGTEGKMRAGGGFVHNLFTRRSKVVDKRSLCAKKGFFEQLSTSCEQFFSIEVCPILSTFQQKQKKRISIYI